MAVLERKLEARMKEQIGKKKQKSTCKKKIRKENLTKSQAQLKVVKP